MRSVDLKSFLIGGLLMALVLCLLGQSAPSVFYELHGRFQIAVNEERAFMVDTATGQVWSEDFVSGGPYGAYNPFDDPNNCAFCLPKLDFDEPSGGLGGNTR